MIYSLTPSAIIEYLYCPRFTYFEYVLGIPQYEEKFFKVMLGREIHKNKTNQNAEYLRKKIGVIDKLQNQYLTNGFLRGEIDEVLTINDGTMAPLDYKFAQYDERTFITYRLQLYCYAVLIEHNFGKQVNKGYLVYTRTANKLIEVEINETNKSMIKQTIVNMIQIVEKNKYPNSCKNKKKCVSCTYKNICTQ